MRPLLFAQGRQASPTGPLLPQSTPGGVWWYALGHGPSESGLLLHFDPFLADCSDPAYEYGPEDQEDDRAREHDPVARVGRGVIEVIERVPREKRHDELRKRERDVEESHVFGAVLPVGQGVASERPVDGVKQPVPDPVGGAECEDDWL